MISKNLIKYIRSLELKKNRIKEGVFVAEGPKIVSDLSEISIPCQLLATEEWFKTNKISIRKQDVTLTEEELRKISFLKHPQHVVGIFKIPTPQIDINICERELCLALDKVQDPGNLGTIIRIADWFGISTIFCSNDTVDAFNPKVIQATMGSIAHVNVIYTDLNELIEHKPANALVYGTALNGKNIYNQELTPTGIIIMGNEGNGISPQILSRVDKSLLIPCYQQNQKTNSLNVAMATALTCAEFRRQTIIKDRHATNGQNHDNM